MKTSLYGAGQAGRIAASNNALSLSGNAPLFTSRRRSRKFLAYALACAALVAVAAAAVGAQTIYGVSARRTAVVATGSGVAVPRRTVVAGRPTLPPGYIGVLPGGYRTVVVRGARYYSVGGIYYRAQFYQGRTVYVRTHI